MLWLIFARIQNKIEPKYLIFHDIYYVYVSVCECMRACVEIYSDFSLHVHFRIFNCTSAIGGTMNKKKHREQCNNWDCVKCWMFVDVMPYIHLQFDCCIRLRIFMPIYCALWFFTDEGFNIVSFAERCHANAANDYLCGLIICHSIKLERAFFSLCVKFHLQSFWLIISLIFWSACCHSYIHTRTHTRTHWVVQTLIAKQCEPMISRMQTNPHEMANMLQWIWIQFEWHTKYRKYTYVMRSDRCDGDDEGRVNFTEHMERRNRKWKMKRATNIQIIFVQRDCYIILFVIPFVI